MFWVYICSIILIMGNVFNFVLYHKNTEMSGRAKKSRTGRRKRYPEIRRMDYLKTKMTDDNIRGISMLGLAHLGDAVFELMVRSWLCVSGRATAKGLHRASVSWVSAGAQARAAGKLLPALSPEEADMYRAGATRGCAPFRAARRSASTTRRPGSRRCSDTCT
jgi:23S rRNA maturation mini-RNase III